jgi:hypothetical protein
VHAIDRIDRKSLKQSILNHALPATLILLSGLKDEVHDAIKIPRLGEVSRGAEQHSGVPIVPARVHDPADGQRVHVGAKADRPRTVTDAKRPDDARPGESSMHIEPKTREEPGDEIRRPMFLKRELRVRVDVVPPRSHIIMQ